MKKWSTTIGSTVTTTATTSTSSSTSTTDAATKTCHMKKNLQRIVMKLKYFGYIANKVL